MTIKEAILKSLEDIGGLTNYLEVSKNIIDNKYYDFKEAKTPTATVSALLGDFIRNGDTRIKRIKEAGGYLYYLTKNESLISIEKLSGETTEVKSSLIYYRQDYIFGLDNTPTFERDFESQTEDNKKISYIYDENQKEFNRFIKKYPNSPTSKLIKLFIENHKKMQEEALFELIRNEINKK